MPTDTAAQLTNIIDARVNRHRLTLSPVEQPELLRMIISQIPLEGRSVARLVNRKWNACTTYTQREQNTILFNSTNVDTIDWLLHDPRVDPSIEYNKAIFLASAIGQRDVVARLLKDPRVDPSDGGNRALIYASARGHLGVVDRLLQDPRVDPSDDDNDAIIAASSRGHLAIVERLLRDPRVDPSDDDNWAIRIAVAFKRTEVAILLLQDPRVNPSDAILHASETGQFEVFAKMLAHPRVNITGIEDHLIKNADAGGPALLDHLCQDPRINPSAFRRACFEGNTAIISRLLSVTSVDPSVDDNFAIRTASALGHSGVVKLLLQDPRVDPSVDDNFAIRIASARGHSDIVKLLSSGF